MIARADTLVALRSPRLFMFNVLVPAALVGPIAFSSAPRIHAVVVYTVLFTFFGVFGSAIPLVRDATTGLFARLTMTGMSPHRLLFERLAASALLDVAQLAPSLALIAIAERAGVSAFLIALLALAMALVVANAIGQWVAAFAGSIAEAALFAAVIALLGLHASGVFRPAPPGSFYTWSEAASPFTTLHRSLGAMTGASSPSFSGALLGAMLAVIATVAAAPVLAARLESVASARD